jgi:hypothetical protein
MDRKASMAIAALYGDIVLISDDFAGITAEHAARKRTSEISYFEG